MKELQVSTELLEYAASTVKKKNTCRDVAQWLKKNSHSLESYLIALTLLKYGAFDNERYKAVAEDFKVKHNLELEQSYSYRMWPVTASPLYQEVIKSLDSNDAISGLK